MSDRPRVDEISVKELKNQAEQEERARARDPKTATFWCVCKSEYQDRRYGPSKRLHNRTKQAKKPSERGWRCSVCGHERGNE